MEEGQIGIAIVAGSAITLVIVVFVLYLGVKERKKYLQQQNELERLENEKQQEVLRAVIRTEGKERRRISRDLHDSVGHKLSMMRLELSRKSQMAVAEADSDMASVQSGIEEVLDLIRSACFRLFPGSLEKYGLTAVIEQTLSGWRDTGISTSFSGDLPDLYFGSPEARLHIFRGVQEVINNIMKHARCTRLGITISKESSDVILIEVAHNGSPFSDADAAASGNKGIGLSSIRSRLDLVKGSISYI